MLFYHVFTQMEAMPKQDGAIKSSNGLSLISARACGVGVLYRNREGKEKKKAIWWQEFVLIYSPSYSNQLTHVKGGTGDRVTP